MRPWRGVFTRKSRSEVLGVGFDRLPSEVENLAEFITAKILDGFLDPGDERKLTAFSRSEQVALRFVGNRGWLLELEIDASEVVDAPVLLERARSEFSPGSPEWERVSEAIDMAASDEEVFLKPGAHVEVVGVHLVGGIERRDV